MIRIRKIIDRIVVSVLLAVCASPAAAQHLAVKSNALYWVTTTPNVAIEYRLAPRWTIDLSAGFNPFTFSENKKIKHLAIQPELRYWLCSAFAGHFFGLNLLYSHYNAGNVDMPFGVFPELKDHRFQGDLGAIGIGYGYSWMLSRRWSIEAEATLGVGVTNYKKYNCERCGSQLDGRTRWLFMPTRLSVAVVYNIR